MSRRELTSHLGEVFSSKPEAEKERGRSVSMSEASQGSHQEKKKQKREQQKQQEEEKKRKEEEEKRRKKEEEERLKKEEEERKKKEAEELKSKLRESTSHVLHGYLFDPDFRVDSRHAEEKQAKYEKGLPFEILKQCPNYISREAEAEERNRVEIAMHNEQMRLKDLEEAKKKEKEEKKARKAEKKKRKEEEMPEGEAQAKKAKKEKKKRD